MSLLSLRPLLLALIVALLAYGVGYYVGHREPPRPSEPVALVEDPVHAGPAPVAPPTLLQIEMLGGTAQRTGEQWGVALGPARRVVVSLASLDGATAAFAQTPDGRVPIGPVVAVLPAAGLAALAGPGGSIAVASDPASLRLGLDVKALTRTRIVPGEVDSTPRRLEDGSYTYGVRTERTVAGGVVPLTDVAGSTLIGVITSSVDERAYVAVDAGALQALASSTATPQTIERFGREFFAEQPEGRLIRFDHAIANGDWRAAIDVGSGLLNFGWSYSEAVSPRLDDAYVQAVRALEASPYDALALLDEAANLLGESALRLRERARVLMSLEQPFAALSALAQAARIDVSVRDELRREVLAVAAQSALPVDDRIAALASAAAEDDAYAPYQAALGRLYYGEGRYVEAAASLESALGHDPSPDADLAVLFDTARQRLQTPGQTIAPLHASAGGLYVYASIAGRPMRFVLDTGATYTALSAQAARSLGLVALESTPQVLLTTAGGYVHAPLVTLGAIDVNGAIVRQVPVVILDSTAPFDGLLGMSFLDHFDVNIDRGAGQMRLVRR